MASILFKIPPFVFSRTSLLWFNRIYKTFLAPALESAPILEPTVLSMWEREKITSIIMNLPWQASGFPSRIFLLLYFISFSWTFFSFSKNTQTFFFTMVSKYGHSLFSFLLVSVQKTPWPRSPWVPYLKNIFSFLSFSPLLCLIFLPNFHHYMMPHCIFLTYGWGLCDSWDPSARQLTSTWH